MADTKWSQFPSATPGDSDEVVGLRAGGNVRFSVANFVLAIRQGLANIFVPKSDVGAVNGVAELDSTGKVPSSQLPPIPSDAEDITYDPTNSGLTATNVQDAIDEVVSDLDGKQSTINANGILKGDGQGGVTAATAGTDYQAPLTAGTDYATPAQLEDKANQSQLAHVETGTTASRAYAVGEYFCWNGLLYRVKTAISSGGTITPGTNCEVTMVGSDLYKLDNLIAKAPGSGTRDAQLQVGTYNSVATMNFVSLPSRSPGKPDVYVDFAETYIRVYYVKSDGTTTTKTYLPS